MSIIFGARTVEGAIPPPSPQAIPSPLSYFKKRFGSNYVKKPKGPAQKSPLHEVPPSPSHQSIISPLIYLNYLSYLKKPKEPVQKSPLHEVTPSPSTPYLKQMKEQAQKGQIPFTETHGDLEKSLATLMVFTSLGCEICTTFHYEVLPVVQEHFGKNHHHPHCLSVVVRDYPTTPLSLKMSTLFWSSGIHNTLRENLQKASNNRQNPFSWFKDSPEDERLSSFWKFIQPLLVDENKKKSVQEIFNHMMNKKDDKNHPWPPLLEKIFTRRQQDKTALFIQGVPLVWVLVHRNNAWQAYSFEGNLTEETGLINFIEALLPSANHALSPAHP